jgi:hypothetical protein
VSDEAVQWSADDPEALARQIGGRPIQRMWPFLRGAFRPVFLEPHRRAGVGTVGWRWREPRHAPRPSAADLAVLRRRLGAALLDFADESERRQADAGGGNSRELHAGMEMLVGEFVRADDARLAEYVVCTESGWMIRSWGFSEPAAQRTNGDSEPKPEETTPAPPNETVMEPAPTPRRRRARRRAGWIIAGIMGAVAAGGWLLRTTSAASDVAPEQREAAAARETNETHPPEGEARLTERSGEGVGGEPAAARRAPVVTATGSRMSPTLVASPMALAITGPGAGGAVKNGDKAGPPSRLAGEPESGIAVILPQQGSGATPLFKKSLDGQAATKSVPKNGSEPESAVDAGKGGGGASVAVDQKTAGGRTNASGRLDQMNADTSEVEARRVSAVDSKPAPEPRGNEPAGTSRDETEEEDQTEKGTRDVKTNPTQRNKPVDSSAQTAATAEIIDDVQAVDRAVKAMPQASARTPVPTPTPAPARSLTLTIGVSRVVKVRDVVLATWPAGGTGEEALRTARAEALAKTKAALPPALENPRLRQGWELRTAASVDAANWRDVATGITWPARVPEANGVSGGWVELTVTGGLDARLEAADGRELARVTADDTGGVVHVTHGAEILEALPWFSIARMKNDAREAAWTGRSLSAGWSDKTWRTSVDGEAVKVTCGLPAPTSAATGSAGGRLALVDEPSGWALAVELGFTSD